MHDPAPGSAPPDPSGDARRLQSPDTAAPPRVGLAIGWLVAGALALVVSLLALGAIAEEVHDQEALFLDSVANPVLHGLASPALDAVMQAATFMGSTPAIPVLLVVALAVLLVARRRREATFLVVAIGGSLAINQTLKLVFHRARPSLAWAHVQPEYSFPSGHSQNSLVFYVALALVAWIVIGRRAGIVAVAAAVALSLLVGVSRIYLGYHYLSDVVGGFLAGLSWLLITAMAFDAGPMLVRWRRDRHAPAGTVMPAPEGTGPER